MNFHVEKGKDPSAVCTIFLNGKIVAYAFHDEALILEEAFRNLVKAQEYHALKEKHDTLASLLKDFRDDKSPNGSGRFFAEMKIAIHDLSAAPKPSSILKEVQP